MGSGFSSTLRAAIARSGRSAREIARLAKISQATLAAMMLGTRKPPIRALEPLAEALELPTDEGLDLIVAGLREWESAPLVKTITALRQAKRRP